MLSQEDLERYDRQLLLPELGVEGQERLKRARVLIVGAGGLGSPASLYLAAAGVGHIGLADSDRVEPSNLHRQILHGSDDVGDLKTASAIRRLRRLNPELRLTGHQVRVDAPTVRRLAADHDLVIDGSDNFSTRYAINDACAALRKPWVYGSVERFSGQVAVFGLPNGPCYRCLFPEPPAAGTAPACDQIGVLGAVPGVVGAWQAVEALKLLAGVGTPVSGRMLQIDFLRGDTRWVGFDRRADCPACGGGRHEESSMQTKNGLELPPFNIEPSEVTAQLRDRGVCLLDVREPWELQRASIAGAMAIPMGTLEERLDRLDRTAELIVFCHHGTRSRAVTDWLRAQGFRARNMAGGIDRWSREIDPAVPRY